MLATPEEHDVLVERLFMPAVEAMTPLVAESEIDCDMPSKRIPTRTG